MEKNNAKLNRTAIRWLIAFAALGGFQVAQAGYAQLAPPAGFGGTSGAYTYAANAANDKTFGKVVQSAGSLTANVGGQSVKMGAAYRLAANAPRIAAAVVMQHPAIRLAVGAVGIVAWLASAKLVYDVATGTWRETASQLEVEGELWGNSRVGFAFGGANAACADMLIGSSGGGNFSHAQIFGTSPSRSANCYLKTDDGRYILFASVSSRATNAGQCPSGWTPSPAGCLSPALDQPTFVDKLANQPMPQTVPLELPYPSPLPIERPSPWINPTPGENPQSQPYRVPTGQPQPIPNTNPQQYKQPYIDIVPAPTPDNPFQVDIKPGETTSANPNPITEPKPDDQSEDKPTEEKDKSLCEKHPDILACAKPELDTPDGEIPKANKTITYQTEDTFGGGSCPADIYVDLHGKTTRVYEWSRTCTVVTTYLRPIILLLGAMGALFILIPGRDS